MTLGCPHNIGYDYYVEQITKYIVWSKKFMDA